MMGFQGANFINTGPNKWERLSSVLGDTLDRYQRGQQADEQQQMQNSQLDQKRQEITQKIIQWYSQASPTERARFNQLNGGSGPPGFEGGAFAPSQAEQNTSIVEKDFPQSFGALPQSSREQGAYQTAYKAPMPSESVKLTNAQDVYSNPTSFDPQMQPRQQIEDQRMANANTAVTVGEQTRHNTAEEGQTGPLRKAQGFEATQKGIEAGAGTAKTQTETKLLQDPLGGDAASGPDVRTTVNGVRYADISGYTGAKKNSLKQAYEKAGIPALEKDDVATLHDIDTAKMNNETILKQIEDKLPKDATGRVLGGAAANRLSQIFQTDDEIAAFNANRAAAIRNLRAMAGSRGLRLNQAEIELAVNNDIPKITDTVGVAQARTKNVDAMLDHASAPILKRNNSKPTDVNAGGLYGTYVPGQGLVKH